MANSSFGSIADAIYPDLDNEIRTTRRMLERFPAGHYDWKPHDKSMTLGKLASHVAELPRFGSAIMTRDSFDFAKGEYVPAACDSAETLVATFDERVNAFRDALSAAESDRMAEPWTLRNGDNVVLVGPRGAVIRTVVINHIVHHRAQLGVYYRMLGVPIPGSYGPSADEG